MVLFKEILCKGIKKLASRQNQIIYHRHYISSYNRVGNIPLTKLSVREMKVMTFELKNYIDLREIPLCPEQVLYVGALHLIFDTVSSTKLGVSLSITGCDPKA